MRLYCANSNRPQTVNKARLVNRWGCFVGHALRNFNRHPVPTLTPAAAVPALNR